MKFNGLTDKEVIESREKFGSNIIPATEPKTFWNEFLETFSDPMIRILLVIVVIMSIMWGFGKAEIYEPIGTAIAILIVAFVSAKTRVASDTKYRELKDSVKKDTCKVYRNGIVSVITVDDVVVGDKILLQAGDKVPADGILIDGSVSVNNAALNGETEECYKEAATEAIVLSDEITGDTFVDKHSVFRGSVLYDGTGVFDVQKVGIKTMMGKMAETMQSEQPDSPLKVKLAKLAKQISNFGYIGGVSIVLIYMVYFIKAAGGFSNFFTQEWEIILTYFLEAVSLAIVIIVCAVPEGLPLMISIVLMQNTGKMLEHNVLVRKDEGIETAGSLNILFSDKTGTITKGILEVVEFFTADGKNIDLNELKNNSEIEKLLHLSIGKNSLSMFDGEGKVIGGNATDQALMNFIGKKCFDDLNNCKEFNVTSSQAFNSANKFSQAYLADQKKVFYKGAPERFLAVAKKALNKNGEEVDLNIDELNEKIDSLANNSMRVLAFGYSKKEMVLNKINDDVVIIGLIGIKDSVRPEAVEAISEVRKAGIQVVMITGDRLETAVAIAKDAQLINSNDDIALTSMQLSKMSDDEVKEIIHRIRVIARALPTDKSRMVRLCQEMNLVVGMTGDGVNDSPALKLADVGFAMGSGTEAAKEAGDIVILDDNFKSIKDAIWYGRTIYNNILKFCQFQLVINVGAVFVSTIALFFKIKKPLTVVHLLFVNLVMDSLGAIMLGNEPAKESYMLEKPRQRDESIISSTMLQHIIIMAVWFTTLSILFLKSSVLLSSDCLNSLMPGADADSIKMQIASAYFVLFIWAALMNGFNVRDKGFKIFEGLSENKSFLLVFFYIVLIQALIINAQLLPYDWTKKIGEMFSCEPFSWQMWVLVVILSASMIPVNMLLKVILKNKPKKD